MPPRAETTMIGQPIADAGKPNRRQFLGVSTVGMAAMGAAAGFAASSPPALAAPAKNASLTHTKIVGLMLAHEQFRLPELIEIGQAAARAGFGLLATSDHFQPWQANEQHAGAA
ncbi:MAG: twin-arginine translocation signal domain-containing protein, partial [Alphaproteobacteria bacterium]|nr:twin-arginine translocation signal domain-containing protein [Alphaproteobacteria bacterium]